MDFIDPNLAEIFSFIKIQINKIKLINLVYVLVGHTLIQRKMYASALLFFISEVYCDFSNTADKVFFL